MGAPRGAPGLCGPPPGPICGALIPASKERVSPVWRAPGTRDMPSDDSPEPGHTARNWLIGQGLRALFALARRLPYDRRVPLVGWVASRIVAPLAGYDRRVRENLALVRPDLDGAEVSRICRAVSDNAGRTLIEVFSGREFVDRALAAPVTGPGLAAIEAAQAAGRPVVLISGHVGNYDVARAVVAARGMRVAALYKPLSNPYFNEVYVAAVDGIAPAFPRGPAGMKSMMRVLRDGGIFAILHDQAMYHGARLRFFGQTALTALSPAELALRYDALLVPAYGIRQPDGLSFELRTEAPIPHSTPEAMMQAVNDSLEAVVRENMGQWFWIHRRWKDWDAPGGKKRKRALRQG